MIKILIVDDEKTIRKGLSLAVPWKEHGYEVVYTAKNGVDALDFFQKDYADIVISDIKMPKMDGITLQQELHKKYPDLPFIFLSGYGEFKYAQEAIKYGALSYILKPVDVDELLNEVNRACEQYGLKTENQPLKQLIERNFFGLEMNWDFTDYEYLEKAYNENYFCIINVRCKYNDMRSQIFMMAFQARIQDALAKQFTSRNAALVEATSRGVVFCVMNKNKESLKYGIHRFIEILNEKMEDYSSTDFGVWTGGVYQGIGKLVDSYVESFEENTYVYVRSVEKKKSSELLFFDVYSELFSTEDEIISLLLQNEIYKAMEQLEKQKDLALQQHMQGDDVRLYLRHLMYRYMKALKEVNPCLSLPEEIQISSALACMSISEMFEKMYKIILQIHEDTPPLPIKQSETNIKKVKKYIEDNYSDPYLSLSAIADYVYLNASYLSTEFAKKENITISNYITNIRMEKAKQLLLHSEMRISEISTAVGYINSTYFSTSFRKATDYSPSDYRKNYFGRTTEI